MPKNFESKRNILFVMFDQLRFDYLSCSGHPHLKTPHIDRIAERGVRFDRCYVQSPICGSSRMSFYTGRYVSSHGAQWNNFPIRAGEQTIGDHLRKLDVESWLVGKTHMSVDREGMERLGIDSDTIIGARLAECGFDVFLRDDGLWSRGPDGFYDERRSPYNEYLRSRGYEGENPWHDHANSALDENDNIASGLFLGNASRPANIREEDSETPWLTREVIRFLESRKNDDSSFLCHASYIKPHWPYIVSAPYHNMYDENHIVDAVRDLSECESPHPVVEQFMNNPSSLAFRRDEVRRSVIPAYMGLIKQCDDQMGVLFDYMESNGMMNNTMIVITSDHGDYLGDHWLGEKGLFHDPSVRIPLIIFDPSEEADSTRGSVCDALVESVDLAATFVDFLGGEVPDHIIEGRSLLPFLYGDRPSSWRDYVISEYDYSATPACAKLGLAPRDARLFMVSTNEHKLVHAEGLDSHSRPFAPILFDLTNDPDELRDVGTDSEYQSTVDIMYSHLRDWGLRLSQRVTKSESDIISMRGRSSRRGVILGAYDESEVREELTVHMRGKPGPLPSGD